jgi:Cd2+/Zn2+-exporting ATPase/Cu+-exporting ATPase
LGQAIVTHAQERQLTTDDPQRFAYTPSKGIACQHDDQAILVGSQSFLAENQVPMPTQDQSQNQGTLVHVANDGQYLGAIEIADTLRSEATDAVKQLKAVGLKTILLTGDANAIAQTIGTQLQVDQIEAELLPEDKLQRVNQLMSEGKRVAMVGDAQSHHAVPCGINFGSVLTLLVILDNIQRNNL